MLQSGMTGTWAMNRVRRGKAQAQERVRRHQFMTVLFVEPKKYSLKDDKDLNLNPKLHHFSV